jgi:Domain of unknown function (DUF5615)
MIGRLLIDECLSPELAQLAIEAGHVESTSVRDRGRLGLKDWELMEYVIQEKSRAWRPFNGIAMCGARFRHIRYVKINVINADTPVSAIRIPSQKVGFVRSFVSL